MEFDVRTHDSSDELIPYNRNYMVKFRYYSTKSLYQTNLN